MLLLTNWENAIRFVFFLKIVAFFADDEPTKDDSEATGEKIEENGDVDIEKAAVKIQASYRGYKTRASLKSDSLPKLSEKDESVTKDTNDNIQEEDGEAEA